MGHLAVRPPNLERLDDDSRRFWEGVARGELVLQRCLECRRVWVVPLPTCPYCTNDKTAQVTAEGTGRLYSWIVAHYAFDPAWADATPYVVATVELDEGARIVGQLVGLELDSLEPDLAVEAFFEGTEDGRVFGFRPTADEDER